MYNTHFDHFCPLKHAPYSSVSHIQASQSSPRFFVIWQRTCWIGEMLIIFPVESICFMNVQLNASLMYCWWTITEISILINRQIIWIFSPEYLHMGPRQSKNGLLDYYFGYLKEKNCPKNETLAIFSRSNHGAPGLIMVNNGQFELNISLHIFPLIIIM